MELPRDFGRVDDTNANQTTYEQRVAASKRADATAAIAGPSTANDDEEPEVFDLPVSHEAQLKDHTKTVSALSVDPAGARVCTGGYDYQAKLWDFGGMDSSFRPFRTWEPVQEGSYQVNDVKFSSTGDRILIASATNQVKMFTREAEEMCIYPKGDMYLRDLKNTAGHIAEITQVQWHPKDDNIFMTSSHDSTVRIWDAGKLDKSKQVIVVKSKDRGQRTHITACAYSHDAKWIAAAGLDGCLNVWGTNSNFVRPNYTLEKAHKPQTVISGLTFSLDNRTLLSRGNDGTLKMWDIRALRKPLHVRDNLPNRNQETNVIFSPDESLILTGTAGRAIIAGDKTIDAPDAQGAGDGKLAVLRREDLSVVRMLDITPGNVVKVQWHPKINQIFCSTSLGSVHVLYSPETSIKGATLSLNRVARVKKTEETIPTFDQIFVPDNLPQFRDSEMELRLKGKLVRKKREEAGQQKGPTNQKSSVMGPGSGGRVGASATQHLVQGLQFNRTRDEDPREALLKYADKADKDKLWTKVYDETQPKTLFDTQPAQEAYDETGRLIEPQRKKRKTEGLAKPQWFGK